MKRPAHCRRKRLFHLVEDLTRHAYIRGVMCKIEEKMCFEYHCCYLAVRT